MKMSNETLDMFERYNEMLRERFAIEYRINGDRMSARIQLHNDENNFSQICAATSEGYRQEGETDEQMKIRALEHLLRHVVYEMYR